MKTFKDFLIESIGDEREIIFRDFINSKEETEKLLKSGKVIFMKGLWDKSSDIGMYESKGKDGKLITISFASSTNYSLTGRLRMPAKTKYKVYVSIRHAGRILASVVFASSTGESEASSEKVEAGKNKAIIWAEKVCGIQLAKFNFTNF